MLVLPPGVGRALIATLAVGAVSGFFVSPASGHRSVEWGDPLFYPFVSGWSGPSMTERSEPPAEMVGFPRSGRIAFVRATDYYGYGTQPHRLFDSMDIGTGVVEGHSDLGSLGGRLAFTSNGTAANMSAAWRKGSSERLLLGASYNAASFSDRIGLAAVDLDTNQSSLITAEDTASQTGSGGWLRRNASEGVKASPDGEKIRVVAPLDTAYWPANIFSAQVNPAGNLQSFAPVGDHSDPSQMKLIGMSNDEMFVFKPDSGFDSGRIERRDIDSGVVIGHINPPGGDARWGIGWNSSFVNGGNLWFIGSTAASAGSPPRAGLRIYKIKLSTGETVDSWDISDRPSAPGFAGETNDWAVSGAFFDSTGQLFLMFEGDWQNDGAEGWPGSYRYRQRVFRLRLTGPEAPAPPPSDPPPSGNPSSSPPDSPAQPSGPDNPGGSVGDPPGVGESVKLVDGFPIFKEGCASGYSCERFSGKAATVLTSWKIDGDGAEGKQIPVGGFLAARMNLFTFVVKIQTPELRTFVQTVNTTQTDMRWCADSAPACRQFKGRIEIKSSHSYQVNEVGETTCRGEIVCSSREIAHCSPKPPIEEDICVISLGGVYKTPAAGQSSDYNKCSLTHDKIMSCVTTDSRETSLFASVVRANWFAYGDLREGWFGQRDVGIPVTPLGRSREGVMRMRGREAPSRVSGAPRSESAVARAALVSLRPDQRMAADRAAVRAQVGTQAAMRAVLSGSNGESIRFRSVGAGQVELELGTKSKMRGAANRARFAVSFDDNLQPTVTPIDLSARRVSEYPVSASRPGERVALEGKIGGSIQGDGVPVSLFPVSWLAPRFEARQSDQDLARGLALRASDVISPVTTIATDSRTKYFSGAARKRRAISAQKFRAVARFGCDLRASWRSRKLISARTEILKIPAGELQVLESNCGV